MTTIRYIEQVRGTVFDLPELMTLPSDDCNVLFVSTRTLSLLQAFGLGEVSFTSRYAAEFLEGNKYEIAGTSDDLNDINDIKNLYGLEVVDMSCDVVAALDEIAIQISNVAQAGCGGCGSEIDPGEEGTPAVGPGEPWADIEEYNEYKCRGANWLVDGLLDLFLKLLVYDVDFWTTTTISAGVGLVTSILLTTLLGGWVVLVAGAVIALVTALILGSTIDLSDIKNTLISARDDLVCALYTQADAELSETAFLAVLTSAGLNTAEVYLVGLILVNSLVNQLYEFNDEINTHAITTACTCGGADPCPWQINYGTGAITYGGLPFVLSSVPRASYHTVNISAPYGDTGCGGGNWCAEFDATTITQPEGTWNRSLWCYDTPTTVKESQYKPNFPPLATPLKFISMEMNSGSPFTITMRVTGKNGLCSVAPSEGC